MLLQGFCSMGEKREKKILEESGCNVGIDVSFHVCYCRKKVESSCSKNQLSVCKSLTV